MAEASDTYKEATVEERTTSWSDCPEPEAEVEEEYEEVLEEDDEDDDAKHSPGESGDNDGKTPTKGKKTWVFLADNKSTAYRKKLKKEFADKPMSVKRYRSEMMASRNNRRVIIYPVPIEVMNDPRTLAVLEQCVQIHTQFYPIRSSTDSKIELKGCLQLWFRRESDINRNMEYMWKMAGPDTKIYYDSKPGKPAHNDFYTTWNDVYQGAADVFLFVPFLPAGASEEDLMDLFPLARFICVREEKSSSGPTFRYGYMTFPDKSTLDAAIKAANENPPEDGSLKTIHLIPIANILNIDKEGSPQEAKAKKPSGKSPKKVQQSYIPKARSPLLPTPNPGVGAKGRKQTKQRVVSTKNIKYQQPTRPLFSSPVRPQRWNKPSAVEDDVMALADLLQALGPEAPAIVETLANALDRPQYGGQDMYTHEAEYMSPPSSYQQLQQFSMGRGRGLLRDYSPYQQPVPQQQRKKPSAGGGRGQPTQSPGRPQNQQKPQAQKKVQQNQQNQKNHPRNQGWQPAVQPLMGQGYQQQMPRGRGRGLLQYNDGLVSNYMTSPGEFGRGRGRYTNTQGWSPNQSYLQQNGGAYSEDWDGDGSNQYHVGESYLPGAFDVPSYGYDNQRYDQSQDSLNHVSRILETSRELHGVGMRNRRLQNPGYGGGYQ